MKRENTFFKGTDPVNISLLHPPGNSPDPQNLFLEISPASAHDLQLEEIIAAFAPDHTDQKEVRSLFYRLPCDSRVILYRQAVLKDLLANPGLAERFTELLPLIKSLFEYTHRIKPEMSWLHEVVWRAEELQNIIDCFEGMGKTLEEIGNRIYSEGLRNLQEEIRKARQDPKYQSLVKELQVVARFPARARGTGRRGRGG